MKLKKYRVLTAGAAIALTVGALSCQAQTAKITVQADQPGHKISPLLWGIFFEDINLSADGGIYPELVRNRSFEDSEKPDFWKLENRGEGKSEMSIDSSRPLNPQNRRSLRLRVDGEASLVNEGYWGMALVKGDTYKVRLAARAADKFKGPVTVSLQSKDGRELAKGEIGGLTEQWKYHDLQMVASETDPKAKLRLSVGGKGALWLDMVSVMPAKTWKNHGLRTDLCEMLEGLKPAFVRFPGGCWVEGDDMAHMYHWKNTIGDIAHRKPLWNIWAYWATHGLGYHEYLQLCEDLKAEPLFCINVGMSHREVVPMDQMGQWVQDALDAIEYANGPVTSVWGALRAQNGHPGPFNMKYLEIGNENGGPAYHERYALIYRAIKARYPEMNLIANEWGGTPKNAPVDIVDEHYYNNPDFFIRQAAMYDSYKRTGPKVFVGEYAVTSGSGQGNLRGAIGEAAFMTGMERNSDIVCMASYAPLFVNVNHKRWPINLIGFDSSRVFGLPSYYVQQMFSCHRGDLVLPIEVDAPMTASAEKGGAVGVGTWLTQAEFKDMKVTKNGQTLFAADFGEGTKGWRLHGGEWKVQDGALRQTSGAENIRAIIGDKSWTDYTYSLKARKISGAEGFLILFNVRDDGAKSWWNIGGWGNHRHAVEMAGASGGDVDGAIETGRWYDIRVEVTGNRVKCFLDDKLVHDIKMPAMKSLYASAGQVQASGEIILKVVNVAAAPQTADLGLRGLSRLEGPAQAIVLASDSPLDENTLENPTKVSPKTSALDVKGPAFQHTFPGNSLTILRLKGASK